MELFKLMGKIAVDNDEANRGIDETTDKAEASEGRMTGAFKKIGAAVATYFAVGQIIDFGKQIVQVAAEVAAEASAFEQIMGSYSEQATAKMHEVAEQTGVVDSRLTGYMTSMTAKFKGLGYDIDEATTLAQDGLILAADAAAFWDKSMEDSMSALNSFINGSYEGGEAIGLFANDTQMAAFAVQQGIVDSTAAWANLDEATKQATRLEYAQNMFEQSGATGQAAKEADQYANVMANLKENWRQFQAVIGAPVLEAVQPIMKGISDAIGGIVTELQNAPNLVVGFQNVIQNLVSNIGANAPQMVSKAVEVMQGFAQGLAQGIPQVIAQALPILQGLSEGFLQNLPILAGAAMDMIGGLVQGLMDSLPMLIEQAPQIITNFANGISAAMQTIIAKGAEIIWNIVTGLVQAIPTLVANIPQIFEAIFAVWQAINWLQLGTNLITGIWNGIKSIASTLVNGVKGIFTNMSTSVGTIFNGIKGLATNIWNGISSGISGIVNGIKTVVSSVFNALKGGVSTIFNGIKSVATTVWNAIKTAIQNPINTAKNLVTTAVNAIKSTVSNVFNAVKSTVTTVWNGIKSAIQTPINAAKNLVKSAIDKIKGFFSFKIKWPHIPLPHFTISGSVNPLDWITQGVPKIGIEWYAKGGIMDAPTIFGFNGRNAMVGGEAGAEAIAPIDTLQDYVSAAVREETSTLSWHLERLYAMLADYMPQVLDASSKSIVLDTGELVGATASAYDVQLGSIARRRERGQ